MSYLFACHSLTIHDYDCTCVEILDGFMPRPKRSRGEERISQEVYWARLVCD